MQQTESSLLSATGGAHGASSAATAAAFAPGHAASPATTTARHWLNTLVATEASFAPAIARVALGAVMLPHGAQKLLGWFGGYGFTGTMQFFTQTMHIPWIFAFAAIMAESLGALALIAGIGSRVAALAMAGVLGTAAALVHWQHGFFANWFGNQKGEGIEYFILGLALALIVAVYGGGAASVDRVIARRLRRGGSNTAARHTRQNT